jgi:RNA polymerase sigma-70 factor, ECF subfamily
MKPENQEQSGGVERLLAGRDKFLAYVRSRIADPDLAEDVLQDSLLKALRGAPELKDEARLVPWFYRVLQNAIVDAYRRRGVERARVTGIEGAEAAEAPPHEDEARLVPWFYRVLQNAIVDAYRRRGVERARVTGIEGAEAAEAPPHEDEAVLCECFRELVPALKPEYADLIRALDLDGETPEAAAGRLGITPNNLKVRRHRARQALRARLEETCRVCAEHHCLDCTCRAGDAA